MDLSTLRILQWNCRSLMNKIHLLRNIINEYDIVLLSKTWLNENSLVKIPNFYIIRRDRKTAQHGGVAIIIKNNIPFREDISIYHKESSLESVALSIPTSTNNNDKHTPDSITVQITRLSHINKRT